MHMLRKTVRVSALGLQAQGTRNTPLSASARRRGAVQQRATRRGRAAAGEAAGTGDVALAAAALDDEVEHVAHQRVTLLQQRLHAASSSLASVHVCSMSGQSCAHDWRSRPWFASCGGSLQICGHSGL